jgi:hypothetical protein
LAGISNHLAVGFPFWVEEFVGEPLRGLPDGWPQRAATTIPLPNLAVTQNRPYRGKIFTEKPLNLGLSEPLIIEKSSLLRKQESSHIKTFWIPVVATRNRAFAGMTFLEEFLRLTLHAFT